MNEQQSGEFRGVRNARRFDGGSSPRPNFGGRDFQRGGRDGGQTQMFQAICADCRKPCEVPFRPSGDKPVYCKECFMKRREGASRMEGRQEARTSGFAKRDASPTQGAGIRLDDIKHQMDAMNAKLDTILQHIGGADSQSGAAVGGKTFGAKRTVKKPHKSAKSSKKK